MLAGTMQRKVAAEGVFPKSLRYRGLHATQRRSGERPRGTTGESPGAASRSTEGAPGGGTSASSPTPNLSGKEDRRGEVAVSLHPIVVRCRRTPRAQANPAQCHPPRRGRAHGRLRRLGHAGQLRFADRRASCGTARRGHVRRVAHACGRPGRRGCARLPASSARQQRRQAEGSGQGALLMPACAGRRRPRRPDRLFPARGLLSHRRQRRDRRQGHRVVPPPHRRARAAPDADAALGTRDDRRTGTQRACQGLAGAARQRSCERRAEALRGHGVPGRWRRGLHCAHRLYRRGRIRADGPGRRAPKRRGARSRLRASSRAASAHATR